MSTAKADTARKASPPPKDTPPSENRDFKGITARALARAVLRPASDRSPPPIKPHGSGK